MQGDVLYIIDFIDSTFLGLIITLSYFQASGNFCHLLMAFANSLDPDQDRQNVDPDLDLNLLTL